MDTEEKGMINCPNCGKEVAVSSRFCPFCRALLAGVVMLCFGAYAFFTASVGCDSTSFGGDAYTYIYKGIVATAKTLYLICRCLGMALMCGGVAMTCHFASRFGK